MGQQANFALKARAWCSLEAEAEFLAAKKMLDEERGDVGPASVTKLLSAKRSQPPPATIFVASSPFLTLQAPCNVVIHVYRILRHAEFT